MKEITMDKIKLDSLSDYANFLIDKVKEGGDFLKEQLPPVINELLLLERIESSIYLVISITGIVVCSYLVRKAYSLSLKKKYGYGDLEVTLTVIGVLFGMLSVIWFFISLHEVIMVFLAPKLYILDYLRGFLK
jgi:hypothetical protein